MRKRYRRRDVEGRSCPPTPETSNRGLPDIEESGFDLDYLKPRKVDLYVTDVYLDDEGGGGEVSVDLRCRSLDNLGGVLFELRKDLSNRRSFYVECFGALGSEIPRQAKDCVVKFMFDHLPQERPRAKTVMVNVTVYDRSWYDLLFALEDRVPGGPLHPVEAMAIMENLNAMLVRNQTYPSQLPNLNAIPSQAAIASTTSTFDEVVIKSRKRRHWRGCCVVCMDKFKVGSKATRLPCSHVFHCDCILKWIHANATCPLCRFQLQSA